VFDTLFKLLKHRGRNFQTRQRGALRARVLPKAAVAAPQAKKFSGVRYFF
jgi:hypothetical protein